jgi:hypothetical protein
MPLLHKYVFAPEPESVTEVPAQTVWSAPAFTSGNGIKVIRTSSKDTVQGPNGSSDSRVNNNEGNVLSEGLGVYMVFNELELEKEPKPLVDHDPEFTLPLIAPVKTTFEFKQIV